jgi:hypothetical protein
MGWRRRQKWWGKLQEQDVKEEHNEEGESMKDAED